MPIWASQMIAIDSTSGDAVPKPVTISTIGAM